MTEKTVQVGERLAVSYDITNRGQSDGEQTVELWVDGVVVDSDALVVDAESTGRMSLVTDAFTDEDADQLYKIEIVTDDRVAQVMTVEVINIPDTEVGEEDLIIHYWAGSEEDGNGPWTDQSPNEFDLPLFGDVTFEEDGFGGYPSLFFDRTGEYGFLEFDSEDEEEQPNTVFLACQLNDLFGGDDGYIFSAGEDNQHYFRHDGGEWDIQNELSGGSTDTDRHIITLKFWGDGDSEDSEIRLDGEPVATGNISNETLTGIGLSLREADDDGRSASVRFNEIVASNIDEDNTMVQNEEKRMADRLDIDID